VRYERLVIQAGSNSFTLNLHPQLTVIAGVGQLERESLIGELVGALGSSRSGVHAELVQDDGRHLAVFRPAGARHRVVDIDSAHDVSKQFATSDGRIDLLEFAGVDGRKARRRLRLGSTDLSTASHGADVVRELAEQDQARLWAAAENLRTTEDELQQVAESVGSAPEDAAGRGLLRQLENGQMATAIGDRQSPVVEPAQPMRIAQPIRVHFERSGEGDFRGIGLPIGFDAENQDPILDKSGNGETTAVRRELHVLGSPDPVD